MSRVRHRLLALTLLGLLAVPAAWGRPAARAAASPATSMSRVLSLLSSWFGISLPESWLKSGCKVDPNGTCAPSAADGSCLIDPFGGCIPQSVAEGSCLIDPNGRCTPDH